MQEDVVLVGAGMNCFNLFTWVLNQELAQGKPYWEAHATAMEAMKQ
jgi:hypothetical protein